VVTLTADQIGRAQAALAGVRGGADRAMMRALNRAVGSARAELVRQVRSAYRVSASAIRETLTIRRATSSTLSAEVVSTGRRIPLIDFGPRPDRPGTGGPGRSPLQVATSRESAPSPIDGAFVAALSPLRRGVYERHGSKKPMRRRATGKERLAQPLRELFGPAIPQMAGQPEIAQAIEDRAREQLDARLDHEIGRLLGVAA
jgi:hypothetical protein